MKNPFSKRVENWVPEPNRLSLLQNRLKEKGEKILDLTVSNPTVCGFQTAETAALNHPDNKFYKPDAHGIPEARKAVCDYYRKHHSVELKEEQVFITANTSEAYSFVFKLLTDPGDTVLAPKPSYPLLHYLAGLHDLNLEHYSRTENIKPGDARAILLVHPNNPTGKYVSGLPKMDLPLIVDEVFLDYSFGGRHRSFAGHRDTLCFTLSGISKILALPQMKISWIIVSGPEELRKPAIEKLEIIADTYLSASTPSQYALPVWLKQAEKVQAEIQKRLETNLAEARKTFATRLAEPEGGWYAVIEMPDTRSDEDWALHLLEKEKVLAHPGYLFDFEEEKFLVLSLLIPPDEFKAGIGKIAAAI